MQYALYLNRSKLIIVSGSGAFLPCAAVVDDSTDVVVDDPDVVNSCGFMSAIAWRRTWTWSGSWVWHDT